MSDYNAELQKHVTLMGKVQYGMEREGWIYVEQFKEAMRFFYRPLRGERNQMSEYKDSDGNEISLYRLINKEPEWAVNIIEKFQDENKALKEQVSRLMKRINWLRSKVLK